MRIEPPVSAALLLVGAPGAGKSSVLDALGTELERAGARFGRIESEQLSEGVPLLRGEPWYAALRATFGALRAAGRELLLVVATPETAADLAAVRDAVGPGTTLVVLLTIDPATAAARVEAREPDRWPGKAGLVAHAAELAVALETLPGVDARISTADRSALEVADEIVALMRERGLLAPR